MNFLDKKLNELHEKDPSIELLRIIGCISVIATHVKINLRYLKKKKDIFKNFQLFLMDVYVQMV